MLNLSIACFKKSLYSDDITIKILAFHKSHDVNTFHSSSSCELKITDRADHHDRAPGRLVLVLTKGIDVNHELKYEDMFCHVLLVEKRAEGSRASVEV